MLTENRFTSMAGAFYIATIKNPSSPLCKHVGSAIERNRGLIKQRAWNANCAFKTAMKLKSQGVLPE